MEHAHHPKIQDHGDHHHGHGHRVKERSRLKLVILVTGVTMIVEVVAGILTHSLALLSDAFHMLTHFGAMLISLLGIVIATRFASAEKTFGYWRAEILTALFNGLTLIPIVGYILYESYQRFLHPQLIDDVPMLVVAIIGLVVNLITAGLLWSANKKDINMRGAFLHMLGDTLSSVAVIIAGVLIHFTGWLVVDPIASALIAIMIVVWSISLIRESVDILLESVPKGMKTAEIARAMRGLASVKDVHDIHVWQITSGMYAMTCHVVLTDMPLADSCKVITELHELLDHQFHISHATIEIEIIPSAVGEAPATSGGR